MPKKKDGKSSKKGAPKDWGATARETWVNIEVRNSKWASMRFTSLMRTTETLETVRRLIVDQHQVSLDAGMRMYLGAECDPDCEFQPSDFMLRLEELEMVGGSKNDRIRNIVTYEHAPFASALQLPPLAIPIPVASLPRGMSTNIPRGMVTAAMLVNGAARPDSAVKGEEGDGGDEEGGDGDEGSEGGDEEGD